MGRIYTRKDLENMEDPYEYLFPVPYETETIPNMLEEISIASFSETSDQLLAANFSLILCIPLLPVNKVLKQAELLSEGDSFKLLRIPPEMYNSEIEQFIIEHSTSLHYFWIKNSETLKYALPKTSSIKIKLLNLNHNEIYSFWLEEQECIKTVWN